MGKKWLVVVLVAILVVLSFWGAYGWWRLKDARYPYLFETARYRLASKWYLAELQPVFLRQYTDHGARYFSVLYRNQQGKLTLGKVLVGGAYQGEDLPWVLNDTGKSSNPAGYEHPGYRYPFNLGQRIRVTFLTPQAGADIKELSALCVKTARLCKIARLVTDMGAYSEPMVEGGLEPSMPVPAVVVSGEIIYAFPGKGAQP